MPFCGAVEHSGLTKCFACVHGMPAYVCLQTGHGVQFFSPGGISRCTSWSATAHTNIKPLEARPHLLQLVVAHDSLISVLPVQDCTSQNDHVKTSSLYYTR